MAIDHRQVHFHTDDVDEVVAEITRIAEVADGSEWVTIAPWVDPENLPVVSVLRRLFSARGSKIPEVTWVPAQSGEPAQLGVLHATGPDALSRLHERGVAIPDSWRKLGDHSKRGLLFALPPETTPATVLRVAIETARALAEVPTDDRWVAQVSSSRAR